MGFGSLIASAITGLVKPVTDYYTRKRELTAQEHANALAVLEAQGARAAELAKAGLAADMQWEAAMVEQAGKGWKDEATFGLLAIPLALCFVRVGAFDGPQIVADGFAALSGTPVWYQGLVVAVLLANYGIRAWRRSQYDTETPLQSAAAIKSALGK